MYRVQGTGVPEGSEWDLVPWNLPTEEEETDFFLGLACTLAASANHWVPAIFFRQEKNQGVKRVSNNPANAPFLNEYLTTWNHLHICTLPRSI
jgi:hypothetical protein